MSRRIFRLFRGRREREREVEEEIEAHLRMRIDALVATGWDPEAAEAEARRRFGDMDRARGELARGVRTRERRLAWATALERARADVALAVRRARRSPGFTALALLTLALGIGLTTAAFTTVDHVLVRPLPWAEPDRLVQLWSVPENGDSFRWVSSENWFDWVEGGGGLTGSALHREAKPIVTADDRAIRVDAALVTGQFFEVLRPRMLTGRGFVDSEAAAGEAVAVVSETFWRGTMGAAAIPAELRVGESVRSVVGVVPDEQAYPAGTDLWLPTAEERTGQARLRNNINWEALGRLAPGAALETAEAELSARARAVQEGAPESLYSWGVDLVPLDEALVGDDARALLLFFAAVGAVLLLACLNLAGLALARTIERSRELGVRIALGAGRRRILVQLLTEQGVLALVGGALGIGVAAVALDLIERSALYATIPRAAEIALDPRAVAFASLVTLLAAVLAGIIPALEGARSAVGHELRSRDGGPARHRLGSLLVAAEVALAIVLLVGSGLLLRSFRELTSNELGFDPRGVLTASITLDRPAYAIWRDGSGEMARVDFWIRLMERLRAAPGVDFVAAGSAVPTAGGGTGFLEVEDLGQVDVGAGYRSVSADYFEVMGIPMVAGRTFDRRDGPDTERVVIVNRALADRFWPEGDALGKRVRALSMEDFGGGAPWLTIVGVVGDVRHFGFDAEPDPEMFTLHEQQPYWSGSMTLLARSAGRRTTGIPAAIRQAVHETDPSIPVTVVALEDRVAGWVSDRMFVTSLLGAFGALALVLAAIGLYGLLAFTVAGRTREIGIRAALGADRSSVVSLVVRQSLVVTGVGIAAGVLAALALSGTLESMLVEVGPTDPITLGFAPLMLLTVAIAAAAIPAWRAARIDPLEALRSE